MREREPQPNPDAARLIARLLGPVLLLALLGALTAAWLGPERDAARFVAQQEAGLEELPPPPPPDNKPGIDNRQLDPRVEPHEPPPPAFQPPPGHRPGEGPGKGKGKGTPPRHPPRSL